VSGIAYINGRYVPKAIAAVHIEDRGFQFADAVYEAWYYRKGQFYDLEGHLDRLERSLSIIGMTLPMARRVLTFHLYRTAARNRLKEGIVYLQVSRGQAPREHTFPTVPVPQTVVITARPASLAKQNKLAEIGIAVITHPDERWARCDVKSVGLLPNVLAKEVARKQGAKEAWFVDEDGMVTEGGSSNAWIVTQNEKIVTRNLSAAILRGITRTSLKDIVLNDGRILEERSFSVAEAKEAKEAFITSATNMVMPVVRIDDTPIGGGRPGPIASRLRSLYLDMIAA
jgi:D-alanine transaminase